MKERKNQHRTNGTSTIFFSLSRHFAKSMKLFFPFYNFYSRIQRSLQSLNSDCIKKIAAHCRSAVVSLSNFEYFNGHLNILLQFRRYFHQMRNSHGFLLGIFFSFVYLFIFSLFAFNYYYFIWKCVNLASHSTVNMQ